MGFYVDAEVAGRAICQIPYGTSNGSSRTRAGTGANPRRRGARNKIRRGKERQSYCHTSRGIRTEVGCSRAVGEGVSRVQRCRRGRCGNGKIYGRRYVEIHCRRRGSAETVRYGQGDCMCAQSKKSLNKGAGPEWTPGLTPGVTQRISVQIGRSASVEKHGGH